MSTIKRVCLVTGAGGRLGNAFCQEFASAFDIAGVYRSKHPDCPSQTYQAAATDEKRIYAIQADLEEEGVLEQIVNTTLNRFGKIDLLIHAAVHAVWAPMFSDKLLNSLHKQFYMNTIVPLKLSVVVAKYWKDRHAENKLHNRNIINVSSIAGNNVYSHLGQSAYSASKAALNQLTRHMADEFSSINIRVNAIAPNSFPRIIPTQAVLDSIRRFDNGDMSGKIHVIDKNKEQLL